VDNAAQNWVPVPRYHHLKFYKDFEKETQLTLAVLIKIFIVFLGGSVPVFDEVILSLSLMNKVQEIDATAGFKMFSLMLINLIVLRQIS